MKQLMLFTNLTCQDDPYIALLSYRATPLDNGHSPAELLMGRKLQKSDNENKDIPDNLSNQTDYYVTRSGRISKPPDKLNL
jgi:hypothetical protein